MSDKPEGLLSEREIEVLIVSAVSAGGSSGTSEESIRKIIDWAENTKMDSALLGLVLDGKLAVSVDESGEICFAKSETHNERGCTT